VSSAWCRLDLYVAGFSDITTGNNQVDRVVPELLGDHWWQDLLNSRTLGRLSLRWFW
jgi:hypothetical protein